MDQENFDDMPALSPQNLDDMEIWTPRVNKKNCFIIYLCLGTSW